MKNIIIFAISILFIASCQAEPGEPPRSQAQIVTEATDQVATEMPTETTTFTPVPTRTSLPSPTATQTATNTSTNTATPVPSFTPSPIPTNTPTFTPTETSTIVPTLMPTLPPVTNTPEPLPTLEISSAPLYPNTPIQPWDQGVFAQAISAYQVSIEEFYHYFGGVVTGGPGRCGRYWHFYSQWENSPGFSDVPEEWAVSYYQYRQALEDLRIAILPITNVCVNGGGTVDDETDQLILRTIENLMERLSILNAEVWSRL